MYTVEWLEPRPGPWRPGSGQRWQRRRVCLSRRVLALQLAQVVSEQSGWCVRVLTPQGWPLLSAACPNATDRDHHGYGYVRY